MVMETAPVKPYRPFTAEHDMFRKAVRQFVEKELNPHCDEWEKAGTWPAHDVLKQMGDLGFLGLSYPAEYGGQEADIWFTVVLMEELGRCDCAGVPMGISVHTDMCTPALAKYGSDELKRRFLASALRGEMVGCIGVTEPGAGSDVAGIITRADKDGDDYVINGSKMWITNGTQADWVCLLVRTSPPSDTVNMRGYRGMSLIMVPTDTPGFIVSKKLEKLGNLSSDTAVLTFENMRVPQTHRIGEEGMGFYLQMEQFQRERLVGAVSSVAGMEKCVRQTIAYCHERKTFGTPLVHNQWVNFKLVELLTEIEALRQLNYYCASLMAEDETSLEVTKIASMCKLKAGRLAREVGDTCLQFYGGMGYMEETPISRYYRDARLLSIGGGADEVMMGIIARLEGMLPERSRGEPMTYRIGSAQGFYGDDVTKALPMIEGGHVDVVCFEALSELTMAILQKDRLANPARGYTWDIRVIAERILPAAFAKKIPLITNGGGLNPTAAAELVRETAARKGLTGLKIAAITGDDLLARLGELKGVGETFSNLDTGEPLAKAANQAFVTANVYLGAAPIVEALQAGADIVIAGRIADPCLYLGALIAHYGWAWDDWDRLAAGIVCGHLLECTGQVVGGNSLALVDEIDPRDLPRLGYPIAEVEADGTFVLTKTPGTPGFITLETVKEQLLYEVHDPGRYLTPDVTANFTTLRLEQVGDNRVCVRGVTGGPRPDKLKVNMNRFEGYKRELIFTIGYPKAWQKVDQLQRMLEESWMGLPIERVGYSFLGMDALFNGLATLPEDPLEVIVRVVFTAADADTLKTAVRRAMANGLSCPAGMSVSGLTVGAEPSPVVGLWSALVSREHIQPQITYFGV
ncbi:MAG: acyclic terpene utilization AtuA family protein [Chloroflexi bacterium]|nr:acyclic terpene utilization AtuA family protein [Chloroflexota bacterium]